MTAEPARVAPPTVRPGGVETIGPLLRWPGRTLHVDQLDEAEQHIASMTEAVAQLRKQFPHAR